MLDFQRIGQPPIPPAEQTLSSMDAVREWGLKYHPTETVDLCIEEADGDSKHAKRLLNRIFQRAKRVTQRVEKRATRDNEILYSGPIGWTSGFPVSRKTVKTSAGHIAERFTAQGQITGLPMGPLSGNIIVLIDLRAENGNLFQGEILWTGSDYRIHLWRRRFSAGQESLAVNVGIEVQALVKP